MLCRVRFSFFFSSRRRHTRYIGDWSSDVCSSDLARHFADGAKRVVIIGTDCPGVTRHLIHQAFTALGRRDVALGPALDGGYYLIGLAAPQAALFRGISWSTGAVAAQTRTRADALGLSCHLLRPLRDVDTARDARAVGLLRP